MTQRRGGRAAHTAGGSDATTDIAADTRVLAPRLRPPRTMQILHLSVSAEVPLRSAMPLAPPPPANHTREATPSGASRRRPAAAPARRPAYARHAPLPSPSFFLAASARAREILDALDLRGAGAASTARGAMVVSSVARECERRGRQRARRRRTLCPWRLRDDGGSTRRERSGCERDGGVRCGFPACSVVEVSGRQPLPSAFAQAPSRRPAPSHPRPPLDPSRPCAWT